MLDVDDVGPIEAETKSRSKTWLAALTFSALGLALSVAYLPMVYYKVARYDDEGFFLVTMRQFIRHGSLYEHTSGGYGPFYYSFIGAIYRLTGQAPTLFNGRMLVLAFTGVSAGIFAAAVWRATRSLLFGALTEVATFCVLIAVAGNEPLHPGSLVVLVLSVLLYALASFSVEQRTRLLVLAGACAGALLMTKVNVGVFAVAGITVALVVGNSAFPRWFRYLVAAGSVLLPFVLVFQRLSGLGTATFAALVAGSMLGTCAVMTTDVISLRPRGLFVAAGSAAAAVLASWVWPLLTGTSLSALIDSVFLAPLQQVNFLTNLPVVGIYWVATLITVLVVVAATTHHDGIDQLLPSSAQLRYLALAAAAVWVIGMGLGALGSWLPAIVLIPALALLADAPPRLRLAIRLTAPVAILQVLHVYPVEGSQRAWSTVAIFVPCAIGLAAGMGGLDVWRVARPMVRGFAVGALCVLVLLFTALWPVEIWKNYTAATPMKLPGTTLMRVNDQVARQLRQLARVVKKSCDTFYSVPPLNSLYIYTGIPNPTGQLANWPGVLTVEQEREITHELSRLKREGKRVCIVRDLTASTADEYVVGGSEAKRPIGKFILQYRRLVAIFGGQRIRGTYVSLPRYAVSIEGSYEARQRDKTKDVRSLPVRDNAGRQDTP